MKFPRFFKKTICYLPTPAGWICGVALTICFIGFLVMTVHPFLAKNNLIQSNTLCVEGWLPDYCLEAVATLYRGHKYSRIFITGGPLDNGSYLKEYKNYAALGAATLRKLGIPAEVLIEVPAPYTRVDRTYTSALALKHLLDSTHLPLHKCNIVSHSTHTRRSTLLFRLAIGKKCSIGSIAIPDRTYNSRFWWKYSKGVRSVIDESIAYFYALLFITTIK